MENGWSHKNGKEIERNERTTSGNTRRLFVMKYDTRA